MLSGILLLDKPLGLSSNAALQRVRRLLRAEKAGHVGSLDPLATGMLPICLGEATKIAGRDPLRPQALPIHHRARRSHGDGRRRRGGRRDAAGAGARSRRASGCGCRAFSAGRRRCRRCIRRSSATASRSTSWRAQAWKWSANPGEIEIFELVPVDPEAGGLQPTAHVWRAATARGRRPAVGGDGRSPKPAPGRRKPPPWSSRRSAPRAPIFARWQRTSPEPWARAAMSGRCAASMSSRSSTSPCRRWKRLP